MAAAASAAASYPRNASGGRLRPVATGMNMRVLGEATQDPWAVYDRIRQLGVPGAFGKAYLVKTKRGNDLHVIKEVAKRPDFAHIKACRQEIETMQTLSHPNIIRFDDVFETPEAMFIVMEYAPHGDLYDRIERFRKENQRYSERDVQDLMRQVLDAVNYMHQKNVAHLDLKPENMVFGADGKLRIIDFGMARFWDPEQREIFTEAAGTRYYQAPEVVVRQYTLHCDMWAVGVITYFLLVGFPPFYDSYKTHMASAGNNKTEAERRGRQGIKDRIMRGFRNELSDEFGQGTFVRNVPLSDSARDFITKLLDSDVATRLTAAGARAHPWITTPATDRVLPSDVLHMFSKFRARHKLHQLIALMMRDMIPDYEVARLRRAFNEMDTNKDGYVSPEEFRNALMAHGARGLDEAKILETFRRADVDGDGQLCWDEIMQVSVHLKLLEKEERVGIAFKRLDMDNDGKVTAKEVAERLSVDDGTAKVLVQEADIDGDGSISYNELLRVFRAQTRRLFE
jgi:calcium-dependent protein kinase